jgi:hypothetical protein
MPFHALNRGVGRMQIFRAEKDYEVFGRVLEGTIRIAPVRTCVYLLLPGACQVYFVAGLSLK